MEYILYAAKKAPNNKREAVKRFMKLLMRNTSFQGYISKRKKQLAKSEMQYRRKSLFASII